MPSTTYRPRLPPPPRDLGPWARPHPLSTRRPQPSADTPMTSSLSPTRPAFPALRRVRPSKPHREQLGLTVAADVDVSNGISRRRAQSTSEPFPVSMVRPRERDFVAPPSGCTETAKAPTRVAANASWPGSRANRHLRCGVNTGGGSGCYHYIDRLRPEQPGWMPSLGQRAVG